MVRITAVLHPDEAALVMKAIEQRAAPASLLRRAPDRGTPAAELFPRSAAPPAHLARPTPW